MHKGLQGRLCVQHPSGGVWKKGSVQVHLEGTGSATVSADLWPLEDIRDSAGARGAGFLAWLCLWTWLWPLPGTLGLLPPGNSRYSCLLSISTPSTPTPPPWRISTKYPGALYAPCRPIF